MDDWVLPPLLDVVDSVHEELKDAVWLVVVSVTSGPEVWMIGTLVLADVEMDVETVEYFELEEDVVVVEPDGEAVALDWVEDEETGNVGGEVVTVEVDIDVVDTSDSVETCPVVCDCGPSPAPERKKRINTRVRAAMAAKERRNPLFIEQPRKDSDLKH